jgi:putative PIN family toxin of toxin-antitoxin system
MRVVLDTNTLISALFWDAVPGQVYEAGMDGKYILLTSGDMLAELENVLGRAKFIAAMERIQHTPAAILQRHREVAALATAVAVSADAVRDSKDRMVLGCAVGGKSDYIVSGDQDLLVLGQYEGIPIITAAEFLKVLKKD